MPRPPPLPILKRVQECFCILLLSYPTIRETQPLNILTIKHSFDSHMVMESLNSYFSTSPRSINLPEHSHINTTINLQNIKPDKHSRQISKTYNNGRSRKQQFNE